MLSNYKDLVIELTKKEIKIKYKNSYLGYFWSILSPLMLAWVFYFVFHTISRMNIKDYTLFLVTGLFVWTWLSNTIQVSTMLFVGNAPLIKKVNFPRNILAISLVMSEGFNFIFTIPIVAAFMLYYSHIPSLNWIYGIPILFIISAVFIYGLSLVTGVINLIFRDIERVVIILMTILFYATPILYPASKIPQKYHYLLYANPFSSFVIAWRDLLLHGILNYNFIAIAICYSLVSFLLGTLVYNKFKYKLAELI